MKAIKDEINRRQRRRLINNYGDFMARLVIDFVLGPIIILFLVFTFWLWLPALAIWALLRRGKND